MPHLERALKSILTPHDSHAPDRPVDSKDSISKKNNDAVATNQYVASAQVTQQYKQSRDQLQRYNRLVAVTGILTVIILTLTIVGTIVVNDRAKTDIDIIQKSIDLWVEYVTLFTCILQTETGYRGYVLNYNNDTTALSDVQSFTGWIIPAAAQFQQMLQQQTSGTELVDLQVLLQHETADVQYGMTAVQALYESGNVTDDGLRQIYDTVVTPFTLNGMSYTAHYQVYNTIYDIMLSVGLGQQQVLLQWTDEVHGDVSFTVIFTACLLGGVAMLVVAQAGSVLLQRRASQRMNSDLALSLEQANSAVEMKSNFLATMSHELRSPMNGVVAMAELLSTMPLDEEQSDILNTIRISGSSMMVLIDDLLTFSKMEAGKFSLSPTLFKLDSLLKDVSKVFTLRTTQKNLAFQLYPATNLPTFVFADQGRLRQCLVNLCDNSLKFTSTGYIKLSVHIVEESVDVREPSVDPPSRSSAVAPAPPAAAAAPVPQYEMVTVEFSVEDTGIGISDAAQQHIFKPFVQADMSTTRKYGGTGLGLSILKELVDLMGGSMHVRSSIGTGSCFHFTIRCPYSEKADDIRFCTPPPTKCRRINGASPVQITTSVAGKVIGVSGHNSGVRRRSLTNNKEMQGVLPDVLRNGDAVNDDTTQSLIQQKSVSNNYMANHKGSFSRPTKHVTDVSPLEPIIPLTGLAAELTSPTDESTKLLQSQKSYNPVLPKSLIQRDLTDPSIPVSSNPHPPSSRTASSSQRPSLSVSSLSPYPQPSASVRTSKPLTGAVKHPIQKLHILLVEDSPINQKVAVKLLSRHQHNVVLAENGAEALALYKQHNGDFDCVLMDVHMPVMDGLAATRAIREYENTLPHRLHNPVHIVSMTAGVLDEDRAACKQAGMNAFLSKPFTIQLLDTRLHECVQKMQERVMEMSKDNSHAPTPTNSFKVHHRN